MTSQVAMTTMSSSVMTIPAVPSRDTMAWALCPDGPRKVSESLHA